MTIVDIINTQLKVLSYCDHYECYFSTDILESMCKWYKRACKKPMAYNPIFLKNCEIYWASEHLYQRVRSDKSIAQFFQEINSLQLSRVLNVALLFRLKSKFQWIIFAIFLYLVDLKRHSSIEDTIIFDLVNRYLTNRTVQGQYICTTLFQGMPFKALLLLKLICVLEQNPEPLQGSWYSNTDYKRAIIDITKKFCHQAYDDASFFLAPDLNKMYFSQVSRFLDQNQNEIYIAGIAFYALTVRTIIQIWNALHSKRVPHRAYNALHELEREFILAGTILSTLCSQVDEDDYNSLSALAMFCNNVGKNLKIFTDILNKAGDSIRNGKDRNYSFFFGNHRLITSLYRRIPYYFKIFIGIVTIIPIIIWIYLFLRYSVIDYIQQKFKKRLKKIVINYPETIKNTAHRELYELLLRFLQSNNFLGKITLLRPTYFPTSITQPEDNQIPVRDDLLRCLIKYYGTYVYSSDVQIPVSHIAYSSEIIRASFILRESELKTFHSVYKLVRLLNTDAGTEMLDDFEVQKALTCPEVRNSYQTANPTLKDRLLFESRNFSLWGFKRSGHLVGTIKGFFLLPLQRRPYIAKHFTSVISQLNYWKRCIRLFVNLKEANNCQLERFWRSHTWKAFSKDILWKQSLKGLAISDYYEPKKRLFFRELNDLIDCNDEASDNNCIHPAWRQLCNDKDIIDLQNAINRVNKLKMQTADYVRLAKALSQAVQLMRKPKQKIKEKKQPNIFDVFLFKRALTLKPLKQLRHKVLDSVR